MMTRTTFFIIGISGKIDVHKVLVDYYQLANLAIYIRSSMLEFITILASTSYDDHVSSSTCNYFTITTISSSSLLSSFFSLVCK